MQVHKLNEITEHLVHSSPDALLVVDEDAVIRFANETVAVMFGHGAESLIGKPLETLVPKRFRDRHLGHVLSYGKSPQNREMGARSRELHALRADGSEFPANIRLAPLRVGGKLYVAAAVRDATERVRANQELVSAREEADRANRAKSRFLATASHDLRQPIQTIQLLNAALLKIVPDAESRDLLRQQHAAIDGMVHLLNALLDISRLESGAIDPVVTNVALATVCQELRVEFQSVAMSKAIDFHVANASIGIATDRTLFYQVLHNLVANAIKYTERGFVRLRIEEHDERVSIIVEDSGIGIPQDKLDRIFDEYYQVDARGAKRMGVGLGLAIVREAAHMLGLSVTITSKLGEGTRACVDVPRRMIVQEAVKAEAAPVAAPAEALPSTSRVLLVEDNNAVRLATEAFLKLEGFNTLSAATVADAERMFVDVQPGDIVIADFHLDTKHTGVDLLFGLRARVGFEVPAIILSGDLPTLLRTVNGEISNCVFLSKPVDVDALVQAINGLSAGVRVGA